MDTFNALNVKEKKNKKKEKMNVKKWKFVSEIGKSRHKQK